MAISKALRFQVLRRDDHTCQYCGGKPPDVALEVDHVLPSALGGSDQADNLITACATCNGGKGSTPPDAERLEDVSRYNQEFAAEMARLAAADQHRADDSGDVAWFLSEWTSYRITGWLIPGRSNEVPLPARWADSVRVWLARGLASDDVSYAIRRAMEKSEVDPPDVFRYMAGICWRILREREEAAGKAVRANRVQRDWDGD